MSSAGLGQALQSWGLLFTTGLICGVPAAAGQRPGVNLVDMSLEELLTIEVVSAGKKEPADHRDRGRDLRHHG